MESDCCCLLPELLLSVRHEICYFRMSYVSIILYCAVSDTCTVYKQGTFINQ